MPIEPDYTTRWKRRDDIRYASGFLTDTSLCPGGSLSGGINEAIADLVAAGLPGKVIVTEPATIRQGIKMFHNSIELEGTKGAILTKCNEIVTLLTANGVLGNNFVDVTSVAGLQVGDTVIIADNVNADASQVWKSTLGEIVSIVGLRVTINQNLRFNYTTANSAKLRTQFPLISTGMENPAATLLDIVIRNLILDGNVNNQNYANTGVHVGFNTQNSIGGGSNISRSLISGCKIQNYIDGAMILAGYNNVIENNIIKNCCNVVMHHTALIRSIIKNNQILDSANIGGIAPFDFYLCDGVTECIFAENISYNSAGEGFHIQPLSPHNTLIGNRALLDIAMACEILAPHTDVLNNVFGTSGFPNGYCIYLQSTANYCNIVGNRICNDPTLGHVVNQGILLLGNTNNNIRSNILTYFNANGIMLQGCSRTNISNNIIMDCTNRGIWIYSNSDDNDMIGNDCHAQLYTQNWGVVIDSANCDNNRVIGNRLKSNTVGAIADAGTDTVVEHNITS